MAQIRGPFDRAKTTQKNSPLCGILQSNQKESENMHLILLRNSENTMCVLKHGSGDVMSIHAFTYQMKMYHKALA